MDDRQKFVEIMQSFWVEGLVQNPPQAAPEMSEISLFESSDLLYRELFTQDDFQTLLQMN